MIKRIFSFITIVALSFLILSACGEEEMEPQQEAPQPEMRSPVIDESEEDTTMEETQEQDTTTEESQQMMDEKKSSDKNGGQTMNGEIPDVYVVKDGDTLASIAADYYGDSKIWFEIFAENENDIHSWNKIYVGQKLKMPTKRDAKDM